MSIGSLIWPLVILILSMSINLTALVVSRKRNGIVPKIAFISSVTGLIAPSLALFSLPLMLVWGIANDDSWFLIALFCISTAICAISTVVSTVSWRLMVKSNGITRKR